MSTCLSVIFSQIDRNVTGRSNSNFLTYKNLSLDQLTSSSLSFQNDNFFPPVIILVICYDHREAAEIEMGEYSKVQLFHSPEMFLLARKAGLTCC